MRSTPGLTPLCVALFAVTIVGQTQTDQTPMPKGQVPELGRPTKVDDALTPFSFDDYFPGKWNFEWDVPEGPLGPSGRVTGTTVYKPLDGRFSEVTTEASGVWGNFTERQVLAYHREYKAVARQVTDSRGFAFLQIGTIGGDLGGIYSIFLESTPFIQGGKTIRIKHALRLLSPLNYRVAISVSENGGPFRNYGNPWWRKDASATSR